MFRAPWRAMLLVLLLLTSLEMLVTCGSMSGGVLYVQDIIEQAGEYQGQEVTIDGAYVWRPGDPATSVLALGREHPRQRARCATAGRPDLGRRISGRGHV